MLEGMGVVRFCGQLHRTSRRLNTFAKRNIALYIRRKCTRKVLKSKSYAGIAESHASRFAQMPPSFLESQNKGFSGKP